MSGPGSDCAIRESAAVDHDRLQARIGRSCDAVSAAGCHSDAMRLSPAAFHDAMYLAQHCPSAMIFVPSTDGISHNAAEAPEPEALTLGVRALTHPRAVLGQGIQP